MRKIVLMMGMSLDGYIEGPDKDISWHRVDDELLAHMNATIGAMGGLIHGRVVYELMAAHWPTADADPDADASTVEFAPIWRDLPKFVYSRTLKSVGWNSTLFHEVVPEEVRALKEQPGGDLGLGGAGLGESFLRLGLVDEVRLYVHPVLVGAGKPLFPRADTPTSLRLVESRTFGNGVVLLRYEPEA
ncbi:dihydrofolate reductase family protein [Streptomyces sp. SID13726]|uniref:dihydrofolate reductase family protein n=1 Tax=Streptomyces sp. SID13726 TaxID=2706058 RepID=UPI0013BA9492|nr:dihydrofolate reductase family protein [Streptomyces sp. SID13726]NEB04538.1 dihydrofolate reductase [Streptomyces sp. SID13726]